MGTVQREKTTLALIGLCLVIGLMVLLSSVYYTHANDIQNTANVLQTQNTNYEQQIAQQNAQITALQTQNTGLQQQIAQQNAQISALNTQLSSLSSENQALNAQVDNLNNEIDNLGFQISQLQSTNVATAQANSGGSRALIN